MENISGRLNRREELMNRLNKLDNMKSELKSRISTLKSRLSISQKDYEESQKRLEQEIRTKVKEWDEDPEFMACFDEAETYAKAAEVIRKKLEARDDQTDAHQKEHLHEGLWHIMFLLEESSAKFQEMLKEKAEEANSDPKIKKCNEEIESFRREYNMIYDELKDCVNQYKTICEEARDCVMEIRAIDGSEQS